MPNLKLEQLKNLKPLAYISQPGLHRAFFSLDKAVYKLHDISELSTEILNLDCY
jgi:hypothetical protein